MDLSQVGLFVRCSFVLVLYEAFCLHSLVSGSTIVFAEGLEGLVLQDACDAVQRGPMIAGALVLVLHRLWQLGPHFS